MWHAGESVNLSALGPVQPTSSRYKGCQRPRAVICWFPGFSLRHLLPPRNPSSPPLASPVLEACSSVVCLLARHHVCLPQREVVRRCPVRGGCRRDCRCARRRGPVPAAHHRAPPHDQDRSPRRAVSVYHVPAGLSRSCQYLKCQCLWPVERARTREDAIQHRAGHLFRALHSLRDPFQPAVEEAAPKCLALHQHVRLRPGHPAAGSRQELQRPACHPFLPRRLRDRHVSGRYVEQRLASRVASTDRVAAFYLIGMWYKRSEAQRRYSFFFNSTTLAGAFGGLLAAAIGKMDGLRGYKGWRWIFIIEGGLTVIVAVALYFLLPCFPEETKWLNPEEKEFVTTRLRIDQGQSSSGRDRSVGWKDVGNVFKDYKIILGGLMYFGLIVPAYSYAYFAPGIISGYGYDSIQTQLHSVPPWAVAFGFSMTIAVCSDKLRHRFGFAIFAICIAIAGFAILIAVHNNTSVQYAALFLVAMGAYTAMPIIVCWFNMNLGGHHRRSIGSAWQVGFGNIGGIIASFSFTDAAKPKYIPGYSICISFTVLSMVAVVAYAAACMLQNRQKSRSSDDGLTQEEKEDLGDLAPGYRYLL